MQKDMQLLAAEFALNLKRSFDCGFLSYLGTGCILENRTGFEKQFIAYYKWIRFKIQDAGERWPHVPQTGSTVTLSSRFKILKKQSWRNLESQNRKSNLGGWGI